jgi:hypothetical protein
LASIPIRPQRKPVFRAALSLALLAVTLGACSFANEVLWPSTAPPAAAPAPQQGAASATTRVEIPPSPAERAATAPAPQPAPAVPATAVGQRATQLQAEAQRLASQVQQHGASLQELRGQNADAATRFQTLVGQISARLQVGTTPGNPILQAQWTQAQAELDRFAANIGSMSQLSNAVAGDASLGGFLLENIRNAYSLSGAVEEDHRRLAAVEDDVNRTLVTVERMRSELSEDISRQSAYVSRERGNMTALAASIRTGEFYGPGLASRSFAPAPVASAPAGSPAARRPLVVIRFDRANPGYEQLLYAAVNRALEVRPQATFDVVGVAAARGSQGEVAIATTAARRQAEQVQRSLVDMGLPAQRVRLSATSGANLEANEVHVFVR